MVAHRRPVHSPRFALSSSIAAAFVLVCALFWHEVPTATAYAEVILTQRTVSATSHSVTPLAPRLSENRSDWQLQSRWQRGLTRRQGRSLNDDLKQIAAVRGTDPLFNVAPRSAREKNCVDLETSLVRQALTAPPRAPPVRS